MCVSCVLMLAVWIRPWAAELCSSCVSNLRTLTLHMAVRNNIKSWGHISQSVSSMSQLLQGPHAHLQSVCVRVCLLERLFVAETGWVGYSPKDFQKPLFFNFLCLLLHWDKTLVFREIYNRPELSGKLFCFCSIMLEGQILENFLSNYFIPGITSKHFRFRRRDLGKWSLNETDCTPLSLCRSSRFKYQTF